MILLHAFGTRYDLPGPLYLYLLGAGTVVFVSFLLVLRRPVSREAVTTEDLPPVPPAPSWPGWIAFSLGLLLAVAGIFGAQNAAENILPTAFWLIFWIAVPLSVAIVGNYWPYVSPLNVLARAVAPRVRRPYPERWGSWPAVFLFFCFACGELIFNTVATLPLATALIMVAYGALTVAMARRFGAEAWLQRGEAFSVLFATWGRLGWFRFGAPGRPGFLGGLERPFDPAAGRLTFVLLLLVSVSFDGLLATPAWKAFAEHLPAGLHRGQPGYPVFLLLVFLGVLAAIWAIFTGFAAAVRAAGRLEAPLLQVIAGLLPSLVPIAFGYLLAHNLDYLAINGQLLITLLSDPLGSGLNLFGGADYAVNKDLLPTAVIWYFQIVLIIAVHISAVILTHGYLGRAARSQAAGRQAEWPWVAAMVAYTMSSLWLLAQPIVQESPKG